MRDVGSSSNRLRLHQVILRLCVQATIGPLGHDTALLYSLGTAIIGHHFWTMSGMERVEAEISFFKNVSIMAGLLLPYLMGPGRYSLESKIKLS